MTTTMFDVKPIGTDKARPFVLDHHYMHRMVGATYHFGLLEDGQLVGVVLYGTPRRRERDRFGVRLGPRRQGAGAVAVGGRHKDAERLKSAHRPQPATPAAPLNRPQLRQQNAGHVGHVYTTVNAIYTGAVLSARLRTG